MYGLLGLGAFSVLALFLVLAISGYIYYGRLYMRSRVVGAEVKFQRMFHMTGTGISAYRVVTAYLNARQSGFDVPLERFEAVARRGDDPRQVSQRLEAARRAGEPVDVEAFFPA